MDPVAGYRESGPGGQLHSAGGPTLAGGVSSVVLTLNLQAYTESWMTPEGLPYEDYLEFDTQVTGTVTLSPGRAEGDQWVSTAGHYELTTHLLGTATRENWLWHETTIHEFDSRGEFYSAPGPPAPCDARLALRDGQVDEFFLSLPSSPANENAHVYALRYSRAQGLAEVWIRLPPPFRYRDEYQVWEIPGTITASNVEGSFTGAVVDSRGQPVAGAQVAFGGTPLTTDAAGQFHVNRVVPGPLRITIAKPGFEPYDRSASMPAFLDVSHTFVLKEEVPVGSPLVISVVVTNPPAPLLPGSLLPVTLVLSNRSANLAAGVGTFQLDLAFSEVPSVQDVRLERLDLAVNLPAGGQQSHDLTLRIPADPSEARGGLGARRVLARLTAWSGWPETVSATPWAVSSCFWMGEFVVVMTHGFNPKDPRGNDHVAAWEDFRMASRNILGQMAALPVAGSALEHRVRSYVTMWDSSSGFWPAFFSLFFAKYCEAVAWNGFFSGKPADVLVATAVSQVLKLVAISTSQESRYLAAVAAYRVFHELRNDHLRHPAELSSRYQPILLIGHSRGAALNARVANYLHAAGYLVEDFVSLDGFSTDWPDDAWLIGDISIRREAFGRRKWNYRPEEGLSVWAANIFDVRQPAAGVLVDALGLYVSLFLNADFSGWLPVAGVRNQLRFFDIRAPNRAAYGFRDEIMPGHDGASNHLSIQDDYLHSRGGRPRDTDFFLWNFLGGNRETAPCAAPVYERPTRALLDSRAQLHNAGLPWALPGITNGPAPSLIEPWTFDTLAVAEATLRSQTLSPDADPLLAAAHRAFTTEGRLLNLLYETTGPVRLGLEDDTQGYVILQGPAATLHARVPWISSLAEIRFALRVRGACAGGRLDLSFGDTELGRWALEPGAPWADWTTLSVEVGAGAGMNDLTFSYHGPEAATCEVHVDNVEFTFARPRLRLERHGPDGWRIAVSCPAHYTGAVVLETSTSLEDWVPVTLGQPERGEVGFDWSAEGATDTRFWRARVDF
jgi:hypothetical protein